MYMTDYTVSVDVQVCSDVPVITMDAARNIVEDHGVPWDDFLNDFGAKSSYNTRKVFDWLGY